MSARERETRGLMLCQRERRGLESLNFVAVLTAVAVRRLIELSLVNVRVTVPAGSQLDFIHGVDPDGEMALRARNRRVLSF